jgi:hypothetical protein
MHPHSSRGQNIPLESLLRKRICIHILSNGIPFKFVARRGNQCSRRHGIVDRASHSHTMGSISRDEMLCDFGCSHFDSNRLEWAHSEIKRNKRLCIQEERDCLVPCGLLDQLAPPLITPKDITRFNIRGRSRRETQVWSPGNVAYRSDEFGLGDKQSQIRSQTVV